MRLHPFTRLFVVACGSDISVTHRDVDADGDGVGDSAAGGCDVPTAGISDVSGDCNDADALVFPGADEACNRQDDDCDGEVDEDPVDPAAWYADADADGYGAGPAILSCEAEAGWSASEGDCDDADGAVHPGAAEADCADPVDYNCDGSTGFADADGDGEPACEECDDADSAINHAATEACNGADDNCDGSVGEGVTSTFYADADGDGFGDAGGGLADCAPPRGYVADSTDCDDAAADVNPGATEWCDGRDEDCDGLVDEGALDAGLWYVDGDGDGFGDATSGVASCTAPAGTVADSTDCDDASGAVFPGAAEVCDGVDQDCDGAVDEAATDAATCYADADGDGHGDPLDSAPSCEQPVGFVTDDQDCDDGDADIHPAATEVCDGVDQNCDGDVDELASDALVWNLDDDGDGHGSDAVVELACAAPAGFTESDDDCDDAAADVYPGAVEWCDGVDHDCDGRVNEADSADAGTWYADGDADGYGTASSSMNACDRAVGYVVSSTDCDDGDATSSPAGLEVCDDGVDQDCSGADEVCPVLPYAGSYSPDDEEYAKIYGAESSGDLGFGITTGDFDGDGLADLMLGDPYYSHTTVYRGAIFGFYSPLMTGMYSATAHDDVLIHNHAATYNLYLGRTLANIGDVNGDGRDDLFSSASSTGGVVFYGGDTGEVYAVSVDDFALTCTDATAVPTFDPSGTYPDDEWACADTSNTSSRGQIRVYSGSAPSIVATYNGETAADAAGTAIASGDVDGDGQGDLLIGAPGDDDAGSSAGAVYLIYGTGAHAARSLSLADAKLTGGSASAALGRTVAIPGDLDGDGLDEIVVGEPGEYYSYGPGAIYVISGPVSGRASTQASATFSGAGSDELLGYQTLDFGDVDGDGELDLLAGGHTTTSTASRAGAAFLFYGPFSGSTTSGSADVDWSGLAANDAFGHNVAVLPDVDADGKDEIVFSGVDSDDTASAYADVGAVWLWSGR